MKFIYHRTGEFRPPRAGESFEDLVITPIVYFCSAVSYPPKPYWILARTEVDEPGDKGDQRPSRVERT